MSVPNWQTHQANKPELQRPDRYGKEDDLSRFHLYFFWSDIWLGKVLDLSTLKLANPGYKWIFEHIHLNITKQDQTIPINPQQILSRKVELQLPERLGLEYSFCCDHIVPLLLLVRAYTHLWLYYSYQIINSTWFEFRKEGILKIWLVKTKSLSERNPLRASLSCLFLQMLLLML